MALTASKPPEDAPWDDEYLLGYSAGMDNAGVWGGESEEWLRGFRDGTETRIDEEIDGCP